jgi:ligand-binding sensor domain-containing protein/signal transduction histidine kinase/CheY-like chemotaxis protein/AraC-like DNA-binding protein
MTIIRVKTYFQIAMVFMPLLFLICRIGYSQNKITFDKLTVEDGLSQTSVVSITQDSMGFMWFGTKDGINRYDSRQFEVFKNNKSDNQSLSSSQNVNAVLTDKAGNLWVGTQKGLNQFNAGTKTFKKYLNNTKDNQSLSNNTIRCLYQDRQGNIWVGTENGLNKLKPDGNFERFFCNDAKGSGLISPLIKAIYQDANQNLWIGTQAGLAKLNYVNRSVKIKTFFHQNNNDSSLAANDITSITADTNDNIWIATHFNGLDILEKNQNNFKHYNTKNSNIASNIIRKLLLDNQGQLWIGTINGLSILNLSDLKFNNLSHNPEDNTTLNQNSVYDIYKDAAGSIWVGTYYGGVNVHHPYAIPFQIYKHNSNQNSVSSNIISALAEDSQNNLWIGTEAEGINYFDRKNNTFTNYKHHNNSNSVSSNLIKAVAIDKQNNLWIAAYEGGIDYFNSKTKTFKTYNINKVTSNSNNRITFISIDKADKVWTSTKGNGLFYYDVLADEFKSCQLSKSNFYLPVLNIGFLFNDASNTLWVATDEGLFYLPHNGDKFIKLSSFKSDFLNQISSINQLSSKEIVLGSFSSGLGILDLAKLSLKFYTVKNGLPSNNITGVLQDNDNAIWISTDNGLAQIQDHIIKIYNIYDGLPGNVFNYHSALKDQKGNLFFGGYNGLVKLFPNDIAINKNEPKLVFTGLRVSNKTVEVDPESDFLYQSLNKIDELKFSYQQNVFSIDFAALNYIKPQKNKFAYKLAGFESEWNYVSTPTVTFTNLPSGRYQLLIKGTNNDGVWNNNYKTLNIIINPPFWLTWWAFIIYGLAIGCVLYLIFRYFLIKASLKKEHEVNEMKLAFFTNVSHEIRTPLTLILGPLEKLTLETSQNPGLNKQLKLVNHNAKRLKRLVSELMDFRKIEHGKLNLIITYTNIVAFVNEIFLSFQQLANQLKVNYQFQSSTEDLEAYFDKEQLEKVIFNLLSNAFKFIPDSNPEIILQLSIHNQEVLVRVKDNGKGINKDDADKIFTNYYQGDQSNQRHHGTGIGLALSRAIARLHQGDLYLENTNIAITSFCLILKLGKEHFNHVDNILIDDTDQATVYVLKTEVESLNHQEEIEHKVVNNSQLPHLLVVDDNEEIIVFLQSALKKHYQIIVAKDGLQALDLAFEHIPDLIISDVMMPNMDGYSFCNKIKTDERTRHIPLVLLTARTGDIYEIDGFKKGADAYLTKPFSIQKLRLVIDNLLSLQNSMRQKFSKQLSIQPSEIEVESSDDEFLQKVLSLFEENISNSDFNVNKFAAEIGMSTPVFYKKINALTGLTVNNFMKSIRLKRAMQLLEKNAGNVSEVAYMVGFNDSKYFSKEFRKQFGKSPSSYI